VCPGDQGRSARKPLVDKEANYPKVIFEIAKVDSGERFPDTEESIANKVMKTLNFKFDDRTKVC